MRNFSHIKILAIIKLIIVLFYFPSFAGWQEQGYSPRIEIKYSVILSSVMENALKNYDPEFKIWEAENFNHLLINLYEYKSFEPWRSFLAYQTPSVVIGDFNGDAMPDAVVRGRNKTTEKTIVILSEKDKYRIIELSVFPLESKRGAGNIEEYLKLMPPGKIKAEPAYERPEIELKTDGFITEVFEIASSLHFWKDGKFVSYTISD